MDKKHSRSVLFATVGITLILFCQFIVVPLHSFKEEQIFRAEAAQKNFVQFYGLLTSYRSMQKKLQKQTAGAKVGKGTLYASFDNVLRKQGLQSKVVSIRPSKKKRDDGYVDEILKVRCEKLYQKEMLDMLYQLEHNISGVQVEKLNIKREETGLLDLSMDLLMTVVKS